MNKAFLSLAFLLVALSAKAVEWTLAPRRTVEWKQATVALVPLGDGLERIKTGKILDEPGRPLLLDDGSGVIRLSRSIIISIEYAPEGDATKKTQPARRPK